MKKIFIMLMTGLTISTAAVSCGTKTRRDTHTGLVKARGIKAIEIGMTYNHKVKIEAYQENGTVKNYYVSYEKPIKYINGNFEETYVNLTYVEKYDLNKKVVDYNIGYDYYEAMSYFNTTRP